VSGSRWHVYLLDCDGRAIYTGITTDVQRRVSEHAAGGRRAARFTRGCRQLCLLYAVEVGERGLATRIEARLRKLPRTAKAGIATATPTVAQLLERIGLDA